MLKKYKQLLAGFKGLAKDIYGYQWALRENKDVTMEQLCTWMMTDDLAVSIYMYL